MSTYHRTIISGSYPRSGNFLFFDITCFFSKDETSLGQWWGRVKCLNSSLTKFAWVMAISKKIWRVTGYLLHNSFTENNYRLPLLRNLLCFTICALFLQVFPAPSVVACSNFAHMTICVIFVVSYFWFFVIFTTVILVIVFKCNFIICTFGISKLNRVIWGFRDQCMFIIKRVVWNW